MVVILAIFELDGEVAQGRLYSVREFERRCSAGKKFIGTHRAFVPILTGSHGDPIFCDFAFAEDEHDRDFFGLAVADFCTSEIAAGVDTGAEAKLFEWRYDGSVKFSASP